MRFFFSKNCVYPMAQQPYRSPPLNGRSKKLLVDPTGRHCHTILVFEVRFDEGIQFSIHNRGDIWCFMPCPYILY